MNFTDFEVFDTLKTQNSKYILRTKQFFSKKLSIHYKQAIAKTHCPEQKETSFYGTDVNLINVKELITTLQNVLYFKLDKKDL